MNRTFELAEGFATVPNSRCSKVAFGQNMLVTANIFYNEYFLCIYNIETFELNHKLEIDLWVNDIFVSKDDNTLFVGCNDGTGRVIDIKTRKSVTLKGHTSGVLCIIQCEENDVLTCSADYTIRRWNRSTGECIRTFTGHRDWVRSILYDEKTKKVFSVSDDMTIMVWNAETGVKIGEMKGHDDAVRSIAFVNSATIVSGSWDNTIKIWNTTTMTCEKTISSHTSDVKSVSVTPDGQYILSGSGDETMKIHSVATGECIKSLSQRDQVRKVAVSYDGRFILAQTCIRGLELYRVTPAFPFSVIDKTSGGNKVKLFSDGTGYLDEKQVVIDLPEFVCFSDQNLDDSDLIESVLAIRENIKRPEKDRARSKHELIARNRLGIMQLAIAKKKKDDGKFQWPREATQLIVDYAMKK